MADSKIVEVMARAACDSVGIRPDDEDSVLVNNRWVVCLAWELFAGKQRAALAALREAGYAVVPREPTEAMASAGAFPRENRKPVSEIWRAMIEATEHGEPGGGRVMAAAAPEPYIARDLADMAATASDIAIEVYFAAAALGAAFDGDRDEADARATALHSLREARDGLVALITEVENA